MSKNRPPVSHVVSEALRDSRLAIMLALGFSSGLPFLLVFGTLSAWLRESGVPVTEIGLLSYVALAYSFKFVWAPVIDAFDVPLLGRLVGRRRSWMLTAQAVIALGLIGIGLSNPAVTLTFTVISALVVAFASATQDVVVDGWRIDVAPESKQGMMAAAYQLGYRFALISSGAGALYIADYIDWKSAYLTMAALMVVGAGATLLSPSTERERDAAAATADARIQGRPAAPAFDFVKAVYEPLADLVRRKGHMLLLILPLVALYRLPDFIAGVMANPLYIDTGFTKSEIASVSKLYGVWIGILGAFAGGLALPRLGLRTTLVIGAIAAAGSNLMFSWLAASGAQLHLLVACISVDNFASGFAGTTLIAYMSGLTGVGFAASQYALLSSLYALPGKLVAGLSGFMVQALGYPAFFAMTAAIGIPVAILAMIVGRDEARKAAEAVDSALPTATPASERA